MYGGHRWRYWATGLPGWMRGGGRGWPGWSHHWHGPWHGYPAYVYDPEWAGAGPYGFDPSSGESTAEDELAFLRDEAESLKHYLEGIERRIGELQKKAE